MKTIVRFTFFLTIAMTLSAVTASAQKLVIGERAPELKVQKWLISSPSIDGKAVMVEFFHPANDKSSDRISKLNSLAATHSNKLTVIVMVKDESGNAMLTSSSPSYYPAIDDTGKTFTNFGVKYIPYAVLYDKRGRILWLGNPSSISNDELIGYIK